MLSCKQDGQKLLSIARAELKTDYEQEQDKGGATNPLLCL